MAVIVVDVGARGDQEIAGHHVGALVEELVEGVLAVGAGLAEDDRAGRAHHRGAAHAHPLAVAIPCRAAADRPASRSSRWS